MGNTQAAQSVREKREERAIAAIVRETNAGNTVHVNQVQKISLPVVAETTIPKVQGVLYFTVLEARLDEKTACDGDESIAPYVNIRVGDRIFETRVVEKLNPVWNQQYHIYLNTSLFEPMIIELMSMSTFTRFNKLGEIEVVATNLVKDTEEHDVWLNIKRKEPKRRRKFGFKKLNLTVAEIHITYRFKPIDDVQYDFWTRIANQYDFDHNGEIDPFELGCMLQAIGSTLSDHEIEQLLANGSIPISDLPAAMKKTKVQHLIRVANCPVCGESTIAQRTHLISHKDSFKGHTSHAAVQPSCVAGRAPVKTDLEVIAHVGPCMETHCGEDMLIRNFLFDLVGISWWKERLPEWKAHVQYLRDNGNMTIFNRQTGKWMEEKIPVFSKLASRALYSALPKHPENAKQFLCKLTKIVAPKYDDPMTRKFIPQFIHFYGINMDDVRDPVTCFKTFNEFFYRRFKPHSRPIADPRNHRIAVMPADSRVVVFNDISESTKFWIKGEGFNLRDFLQDNSLTKKYEHGSMAICRLAPEDIHRFVVPATCKVGESKVIDGDYFADIPIVVRENVDVYVFQNAVSREMSPLQEAKSGFDADLVYEQCESNNAITKNFLWRHFMYKRGIYHDRVCADCRREGCYFEKVCSLLLCDAIEGWLLPCMPCARSGCYGYYGVTIFHVRNVPRVGSMPRNAQCGLMCPVRLRAIILSAIFRDAKVVYTVGQSKLENVAYMENKTYTATTLGDELGYFKFGGSSIVLLFEPDKVVFAEDLETQTNKMVETYCWMGSPLGVVRSKI